MRAWHFSENAYPYLPPAESYPSIRVSLPNRLYDPEKGAALYDRFIEEWLIAEDEGVEIMLNEHHQTATCVDPAAPLMLAALARLSRKARLLILGNPIANRRQRTGPHALGPRAVVVEQAAQRIANGDLQCPSRNRRDQAGLSRCVQTQALLDPDVWVLRMADHAKWKTTLVFHRD